MSSRGTTRDIYLYTGAHRFALNLACASLRAHARRGKGISIPGVTKFHEGSLLSNQAAAHTDNHQCDIKRVTTLVD